MITAINREPGYYWVTDPFYQRVIAAWDGAYWTLFGWSAEILEGRDITDINEQRIIEEHNGTR
jgi:PAS domain-containing protein